MFCNTSLAQLADSFPYFLHQYANGFFLLLWAKGVISKIGRGTLDVPPIVKTLSFAFQIPFMPFFFERDLLTYSVELVSQRLSVL